MSTPQVQFGNPDLWPEIYSKFKDPVDEIEALKSLVGVMLETTEKSRRTKAQRIIAMLVKTTASVLGDVVTLTGNGCVLGAMVLSRGMFEYSVMAEYLRRNPREQADYTAFGTVTSWKRYKKEKAESQEWVKQVRPEIVARLRERYSRAAARLKDKNGKVRRQWHRKSLRQMAEEIGLGEQYELPYGLAASIHHGSFQGIAAHLGTWENPMFSDASVDWLGIALISGHVYMLQALRTLNAAMRLGFKDKVQEADDRFMEVWSKGQSHVP